MMNSIIDSIGKITSSASASATAPTTVVTDFKKCMEVNNDYDTCKKYFENE